MHGAPGFALQYVHSMSYGVCVTVHPFLLCFASLLCRTPTGRCPSISRTTISAMVIPSRAAQALSCLCDPPGIRTYNVASSASGSLAMSTQYPTFWKSPTFLDFPKSWDYCVDMAKRYDALSGARYASSVRLAGQSLPDCFAAATVAAAARASYIRRKADRRDLRRLQAKVRKIGADR